MARVSASGIEVRAARPGEGPAIAALWRELWEAHDGWGGYAATRDLADYELVAVRIDADARVRKGFPVLGRHVHLVAVRGDRVEGQVEGWFERQGSSALTPFTCEVRSLVVRAGARGGGIGRALLDALAREARGLARTAELVLAAEVLEPNPARTFYERLGFRATSWSSRLAGAPCAPSAAAAGQGATARRATDRDALAVALLEGALAARRRAQGDLRFDRPRAVDATMLSAIAAHLAAGSARDDPAELVACDAEGAVRAASTFAVAALDPPFAPARRAMLGRFAVDPALDPEIVVAPLLALAERMATGAGADGLELTDLGPPGTRIHDATVAAGARPWSRIFCLAVGRAGAR